MIDETLILHDCDLEAANLLGCQMVAVEDPYDKIARVYVVHEKHVKLLVDHYARGFKILAWSNNGKAWAVAVIKALGLDNYVHDYMAKPVKVIDDVEPNRFLASRVYLQSKYQQAMKNS